MSVMDTDATAGEVQTNKTTFSANGNTHNHELTQCTPKRRKNVQIDSDVHDQLELLLLTTTASENRSEGLSRAR